jgi:phosphinothricin acetyltransferase
MIIRDADEADLPQILAIYNDILLTSAAIYSYEATTLEERAAWMAARRARGFPVIVAGEPGDVEGFATFGDWRPYPAYLHTVEHTVHVRADARGRGVGRALLQALMPRARALGMHRIIGAIDSDNAASIGLHASLGFVEVGRFDEVGRKFDRWLSVVFMQREP